MTDMDPEVAGRQNKDRAPRVIWLAYYDDLSDFAFFGRKIDALSHAVDKGMKCKGIEPGKSIREQLA